MEEAVEEALQELPEAPSLPAPGRETFAARRRRIGRRHRQWRANLPALDTLFDDDAHRAKALAGNAATEAQETLHAWVDTEVEVAGPPDDGRRRQLLAEMDRFLGRWRDGAAGLFECRDWAPEARGVFDEFLDELLARGRRSAEQRLREAAAGPGRPGRLAWLRRPLAAAARFWRRIFVPSVDP